MSVSPELILGPKKNGAYPGREIDCQEAISARLVDLIDTARNAGWTAIEVTQAISYVSGDLLLGLQNKLTEQ